MKVSVDIIPFSEEGCLCLEHVPGTNIEFGADHTGLCIHSNAEGLLFLARICLTLAQNDTPVGSHIHMDGLSFVQDHGFDLIIERV